jgi:hypothetical protein
VTFFFPLVVVVHGTKWRRNGRNMKMTCEKGDLWDEILGHCEGGVVELKYATRDGVVCYHGNTVSQRTDVMPNEMCL